MAAASSMYGHVPLPPATATAAPTTEEVARANDEQTSLQIADADADTDAGNVWA